MSEKQWDEKIYKRIQELFWGGGTSYSCQLEAERHKDEGTREVDKKRWLRKVGCARKWEECRIRRKVKAKTLGNVYDSRDPREKNLIRIYTRKSERHDVCVGEWGAPKKLVCMVHVIILFACSDIKLCMSRRWACHSNESFPRHVSPQPKPKLVHCSRTNNYVMLYIPSSYKLVGPIQPLATYPSAYYKPL